MKKENEIVKSEDVKDIAFIGEGCPTGFEDMGNDDISMPMLLISQQLSGVVANDKLPAGHFYNSVTGEDYGDKLKMVVIKYTKMWYEWMPNQGGLVGIHEPYSIKVLGDKFSGMKSEAGNNVIDTMCYVVALPEHPEAGYLLFNSSPGNIRYLKGWNTQMKSLRLPDGRPAPIFMGIWSVTIGKDKNKKGQTYFSCNEGGKSSFVFDGFIKEDMYKNYVIPALDINVKAAATAQAEQTPAEQTEY